jgi:hypothetical protein
MKLSKAAILALRGMDREAKQRIADSVGVALSTVFRWIQDEDDNLTKAAPLQVIREITGLSDLEILEGTVKVEEVEGNTTSK